jgi:hypothetical protein
MQSLPTFSLMTMFLLSGRAKLSISRARVT